jgi:hypothetical protein
MINDGKRSMNYLVMLLLSILALGIPYLVWHHRVCNRVSGELNRRNINSLVPFGSHTFWIWGILGALILVGPFIYIFRLSKVMNRMSRDFNSGNR